MFSDQLVIGGCQVNAIELAAALRDRHGYDIVYFATPGPMVKLVEAKGLRFLPAPEAHSYPTPARMSALRDVVRHERPDLIHVWEWGQCVDALYSVYLPMRVPILVSHMMMDLTRVLPKLLPTTYGTPDLRDQAIAMGRHAAALLLPPVDVHYNAPGVVHSQSFQDKHDIRKGDITLVTVSRLHADLKSESLIRTIDAVRHLGRDLPLRFIIVGDGDIREKLQRLASETNAALGRPAVVLTGELLDPRPAYAAADIVVGMGGSALRGMAFGKPVVVVGEQGFSAPFSPETAEQFYYKGIYGRGDGDPDNERLIGDIRALIETSDKLQVLGKFSREFVVEHYSLETVSAQLDGFYRGAVAELLPVHIAFGEGLRTGIISILEGKVVPYWTLRRAYHRLGGPPVFPALRKSTNKLKVWVSEVLRTDNTI